MEVIAWVIIRKDIDWKNPLESNWGRLYFTERMAKKQLEKTKSLIDALKIQKIIIKL